MSLPQVCTGSPFESQWFMYISILIFWSYNNDCVENCRRAQLKLRDWEGEGYSATVLIFCPYAVCPQLLTSPCQYLDIDTFQHMEPIRQDSLDEFHDFSFSWWWPPPYMSTCLSDLIKITSQERIASSTWSTHSSLAANANRLILQSLCWRWKDVYMRKAFLWRLTSHKSFYFSSS